MAITTEGMEKAEWTFCYEKSGAQVRMLPWAFLRFGDDGEDRQYVVPIPPLGTSIGPGGNSSVPPRFYRTYAEFMPFRAFPMETDRPLAVSGDVPGPVALHFFGGI